MPEELDDPVDESDDDGEHFVAMLPATYLRFTDHLLVHSPSPLWTLRIATPHKRTALLSHRRHILPLVDLF